MGEYAKVKGTGERVKIGTCESMYYLRADQARRVWPEHGNVDPCRDTAHLLFRFPWPNEDHIAPGHFDDPEPGYRRLHAVRSPEGVEHGIVQLRGENGYLLNMPCPEQFPNLADGLSFEVHQRDDEAQTANLFLNGYGGSSEIAFQRVLGDRLVLVLRCKGCGHCWRLPTLADAEPVVTEILTEAERKQRDYERSGGETGGDFASVQYLHELASRIVRGYDEGAATALGLRPWEPEEVPA